MSIRDITIGAVGSGVLLVSLFFAGGGEPEDVEKAFSPAESPCPVGWKETSNRDEHTVVMSCERDGWIVFLTPEGTFNYAWPGSGPFITNPREVPAWPAPSPSPP